MLPRSQTREIWEEMNNIIQEMEKIGSSCELEPTACPPWQGPRLLLVPAKQGFNVPLIHLMLSGTPPCRLED